VEAEFNPVGFTPVTFTLKRDTSSLSLNKNLAVILFCSSLVEV